MREEIAFIKGLFSAAEAADVLLSLINDKIKFHTVRSLNLRHEEANFNVTPEARIEKLKEAKKVVEHLVLKAHKDGMLLSITGNIEIELIQRSDI